MSPPLLSDDVDGAQKKDRPDDVVEDDKAEEGHQDPQWDAHHLQHTQRGLVFNKNHIILISPKKKIKMSSITLVVSLTSQGQLMILSNLRAMKMNCRMFTEHNTSS